MDWSLKHCWKHKLYTHYNIIDLFEIFYHFKNHICYHRVSNRLGTLGDDDRKLLMCNRMIKFLASLLS